MRDYYIKALKSKNTEFLKILETKAKVNQMIKDKKAGKDIQNFLLSQGYNKEDMEYLYPKKLCYKI